MGRKISGGVRQPISNTFSGTTAERPTNVSPGIQFFNTDINLLEIYDGSGWHRINDFIPVAVATSTTITANKTYWVDTAGAPVTITLPSSPVAQDFIKITDISGSFDNNNLTVNPNGHPIMRTSDSMTVSTQGASFIMVYYNATTGWLLEGI